MGKNNLFTYNELVRTVQNYEEEEEEEETKERKKKMLYVRKRRIRVYINVILGTWQREHGLRS
jgi:hypothetical protein